jgi:demethoxyubiquinone hydroxylase (CLK1/Coq7/Cat5 family)
MSTTHTEQCIDVCNSLLRGEISAIETYTQAIARFRGEPEVTTLEDIRRDHITSANRLRENVHEMGGTPSNDSGAWGAWAKTVEGAAKLMGDSVALKALQEGEEHGEKEYEDALENDDVLPGCKEMIRVELLPASRRHVAMLRRLAKAQ